MGNSAVKFSGLAVNYFAADHRNGPLLILKGRLEVIHIVTQELRGFFDDRPSQSSTVWCSSPLSDNRNAHRTIDPSHEEPRNYHCAKYDSRGNREVRRYANEDEAKQILPTMVWKSIVLMNFTLSL